MAPRIRLSDACGDMLSQARQPIITRYQLLLSIAQVAHRRSYNGASIYALKEQPTDADYRRVIDQLVADDKLTPDPEFPASVYIVNNLPVVSASDVCCLADPFCYVSHLSAMEHYGLTERIPDALHITRPIPVLWSKMAEQAVEKARAELGSTLEKLRNVRVRHYAFPDVVRRRPIAVHETKNPGPCIEERGSFTRIAKIELVFSGMLTEPNLCGGMPHVLEVWQERARDHLDRIVGTIDQLQSSIAKVRAGYILTELLGVSNPVVEGWRRFAQRGGSRLLDPTRPYAPVFSEAWMISLNTDLPEAAT